MRVAAVAPYREERPALLAAPLRRLAALDDTSPDLLCSPGDGFVLRAIERSAMFGGAVCNSSPALPGRCRANAVSETEGPSGRGRWPQRDRGTRNVRDCCQRRPTLAAPLRHLAARDATSPGLLRSPGEGFVLRAFERPAMFGSAVCNSSPALPGRCRANAVSETEGPSGRGRWTQRDRGTRNVRDCCQRRPTFAAPLRHLAARDATSPGLLRSPGEEFVLRAFERPEMFGGAMCNSSPALPGRCRANAVSETEGPYGRGRWTQPDRGTSHWLPGESALPFQT